MTTGSRLMPQFVVLHTIWFVWRGDHLHVHWYGPSTVRSVKVATSTSSQPAAGTGTVVNTIGDPGSSGPDGFDVGAFTYADTVYVTVTPYSGANAAGFQGDAQTSSSGRTKLPHIHGMFDQTTGKPKRTQDYTDGGFALRSIDTAGKEAFDDLYIGPTKTLRVGTVASPSSITKTLRIHASELVPIAHNGHWNITSLDVRPGVNNPNSDAFFVGPAVLPAGVTITAIRARGYRQTSSDVVISSLIRCESDATTTLATLTHATTGWNTNTASLSESVTSARDYAVFLQLKGVSVALDARLQWIELEYTMPDYSKGY